MSACFCPDENGIDHMHVDEQFEVRVALQWSEGCRLATIQGGQFPVTFEPVRKRAAPRSATSSSYNITFRGGWARKDTKTHE